MKLGDPKPLDQDLRDALDVEKVAVFAPDDAKARVLGRVESTLVGFAESGVKHGFDHADLAVASPRSGALAGARLLARPLSLVASFGVGSVAGVLAWRAVQSPPAPRIVYVDRDRPAASAPAPSRDTAPAAMAPSVQPPVPGRLGSSGPVDNAMSSERALLDVARSAFGRGAGDEALAALARHEKLYPNGQLAEEREALAVRALVLAERGEQARARAARFRKRYPTSVMLPAVEAAVSTLP